MPLLEVDNLCVNLHTHRGEVSAVRELEKEAVAAGEARS